MFENKIKGNIEYQAVVEKICNFGIERSKLINQTFELYTLHDEEHIFNVIYFMGELLGNCIDNLTCDEAAMLLMAACCHDIGMSFSQSEKEQLLSQSVKVNRYLETHTEEWLKTHQYKNVKENILPKEVQLNYFRSIHHERIGSLLNPDWFRALKGRVTYADLVSVCKSHGQSIEVLENMNNKPTLDLRLCAILLRLADILDFDSTRTPLAIYKYYEFEGRREEADRISHSEWKKHLASDGFSFEGIERDMPYALRYHAVSKSMEVEQAIKLYLNWVEQELMQSLVMLKRHKGRWSDLILPDRVERTNDTIESIGYVSGEYQLAINPDSIMKLLSAEALYSRSDAFVRELLQNAIDAVRTRKELDRNISSSWKPQINIQSWMDEEGYYWFRIEDNGIGMTLQILQNYFLRIGCSYYTSNEFIKMKVRSGKESYTPISRFGVGILSCFMGDRGTDLVEVSTRYFQDGDGLRLSMRGMSGYYYLCSEDSGHIPRKMPQRMCEDNGLGYLQESGTVVAVRTKMKQIGLYSGFKYAVDRYVIFPEIPVHYEGNDGNCDYSTEVEFMKKMHSFYEKGETVLELKQEHIETIYRRNPLIQFSEIPKIALRVYPLNILTESPYITGAILIASVINDQKPIVVKIGEREEKVEVIVSAGWRLGELAVEVELKFNRAFEEEMHALNKKDLGEKLSQYEYLMLQDYNKIEQSTRVFYFSETQMFCNFLFGRREEEYCVAAHNGIFVSRWSDRNTEPPAVYLFKDKYRPEMNVARDQVKKFPLEVMCELQIIEVEIAYRTNASTVLPEDMCKDNFEFLSTECFREILEKRKDFVKRLIVPAELEGEFFLLTIEQMKDALKKYKKIRLGFDIYLSTLLNYQIYTCLCLTHLRGIYSIKFKFEMRDETQIWMFWESPEILEVGEDVFLPTVFLPVVEKECQWLTHADSCIRFSLNSNHRFSIWMRKNGHMLYEKFPNVFNEFLSVFKFENGKDFIIRCNELLKILRESKHWNIEVPDSIFLVENDLYGYGEYWDWF